MDDDKYPHWRDALFANHNAIANIRCAIHYVFWHAIYTLVAAVGVVVVGIIKVGKLIAPYLGPAAAPVLRAIDDAAHKLNEIANHETTERVFTGAVLVIFGGILLYHALLNPVEALAVFGGVVLGVPALLGILIAIEKLEGRAKRAANRTAVAARRTGQRATQTPGIRRVYGECPVSMEQAPKWFDNIFPEDDEL